MNEAILLRTHVTLVVLQRSDLAGDDAAPCERAIAQGDHMVILDMTAIDDLTSNEIVKLYSLHHRLAAVGSTLVFCHLDRRFEHLLTVLKLDQRFIIVADVETALSMDNPTTSYSSSVA